MLTILYYIIESYHIMSCYDMLLYYTIIWKVRGLDEFAMPSEDWMTVSLRAGAGERQEVPEDVMEL